MAMDLTGLGVYTDYMTDANRVNTENLQKKLENTANTAQVEETENEALLDACKQFEAYFVEQLYKGMLKTIPQNEETSNYTSTIMDYYKDQMIQSVAEQTTAQSSLGLAQMLYEQMKRNYGLDTVSVQDAENAAGME